VSRPYAAWDLLARVCRRQLVLIISIAGAFLLIVATLPFEIYGSTGFSSELRFTGVLILNLIFGAAGYLCFGRPRLRL
jgi:hypothetical protein